MSTSDGWINMTERKPEQKDFPVWYYQGGRPILYESATNYPDEFTHWKSAVIPAPPAKELTQREKDDAEFSKISAEQKYDCWEYTEDSANDAWHAALAWERKQVAELMASVGDRPPHTVHDSKWAAIESLRRRCGLDQ